MARRRSRPAARRLVAASLASALWLSFAGPASAQTCAWGGTPLVPPPSATSLRAERDLFHGPARLAIDSAGRVYATDPRPGRVVVRDRYGRLDAALDGFATPLGIAVDGAGRIYVGEHGRGRVRVFDAGWNLVGQLGAGDSEFVMPGDIAVDPDTGSVYVADSGAAQVKVYSADGQLLSLFGGRGTTAGRFRFPSGIHVSDGEVFVADQDNDRVQVFDRTGSFLRCFGRSGSMSFSRKFGSLQGLTGDGAGRLYVADAFQGWIRVLDRRGALLGTIGGFGSGPGQSRTPMDVAIDPSNRLFVASANNARLEVFGLDTFADPRVIAAVVDIDPDTLSRSHPPGWITAYLELPGYPPGEVDLASVAANGVPAAPSPVAIGDSDGDGVADLMVTFDAAAVLAPLADGDAVVVVSGTLRDGTPFEGTDTLRVLSPPPSIPALVDVAPGTLNRSGEQRWITAYIEVPGARLEDVQAGSITANGVRAEAWPVEIGDHDTDGVPDLMVKLDAAAVLSTLPDGDAVIAVSGALRDGAAFQGTATVRVLTTGSRP